MRKLYTALMALLLVAAFAATSVTSASAEPLLCKHEKCGSKDGAWEIAEKDAEDKWAGALGWASTERCEGPFENVEYKTQWACYGHLWTYLGAGEGWQINLDPYGHITYEHLD